MSFEGARSFWKTDKPRWCPKGNWCPWLNCKLYHKLCVNHSVHISTNGKVDPCPYGDECDYDHRDFSRLRIRDAYTEMDLWDEFMEKGLDAHSSTTLNMSEMAEEDRELLQDRLIDYRIEFDYYGGDLIFVYF